MLRRALKPEMNTLAGWLRRAKPARTGGKSSRSVSSSASRAVRAGKARIRRSSWLFFLCLRVGRQPVAEALPPVTQLRHVPPHRGDGDRILGQAKLQIGLEQRGV